MQQTLLITIVLPTALTISSKYLPNTELHQSVLITHSRQQPQQLGNWCDHCHIMLLSTQGE